MLVDEYTSVNWGSLNKKHYEGLGYIFTGGGTSLLIKTIDLPKGSRHMVRVVCAICGKEKHIQYQDYVNKAGDKYRCTRCKKQITDFTGKVINGITVLNKIEPSKGSDTKWLCICHCNNLFTATSIQLRHSIQSCGCSRRENLIGLTFGKLTVLLEIPTPRVSRAIRIFICICECGTITLVTKQSLTSGVTKSCGCLKHRRGKESPRYDPSITDEERINRRFSNLDYVTWRKTIEANFENRCHICNDTKDSMHAHHLLSYKKYPESRYEVSNGVLLCPTCHKDFHMKYGYINFTADNYNEYYQLRQVVK